MEELLNEAHLEQLMQELEGCAEKFAAANDAKDSATRTRIYLRMQAIRKEVDDTLAAQLAAADDLLKDGPWIDPADERARAARLLRGFEFCANLRRVIEEVLGDVDTKNKVTSVADKIVKALDTIGTGREQHLAPLLDHPTPDVRAWAGCYLLKVAPERALPVLRKVYESERGSNAGWDAMRAIFMYEHDPGRFKI